jgi:hypothetical protein
MKSVRFTQVVEKSGKPEVYFRFGPLEKDPGLQRAVKQKRVMTVHREPRGQRKDYGRVGLHEDPHAQILIFPKSLASFAGKHVIAINYDLVPEEMVAMRPDAEGEGWKPRRRKDAKESAKPRTEAEPGPEQAAVVARSEPERKSPRRRAVPSRKEPGAADAAKILREVRAALRELKGGRTVAAYQRLERLVD